MLFEMLLAWGAKLHGDKLESLLLKSFDDRADEATLDTIRLDHDEGALLVLLLHVEYKILVSLVVHLSDCLKIRLNPVETNKLVELLNTLIRSVIIIADSELILTVW